MGAPQVNRWFGSLYLMEPTKPSPTKKFVTKQDPAPCPPYNGNRLQYPKRPDRCAPVLLSGRIEI